MEPAAFPRSEFVSLPEKNREFQGEARGDHHTTVMMKTTEPPPRDYIVWSIFSLVYFNPCCLGLVALYYSVKARDRKTAGDLEASRKFGSKAGWFNKVSLILGVVVFSIFVITFITLGIKTYNQIRGQLQDNLHV
ncbi:dispanin subfamily A member 2b-like [Diretmus argenteus]